MSNILTILGSQVFGWVDHRISGLNDRQILVGQLGPLIAFLVFFAVLPVAFVFIWSFWGYEGGEFVLLFSIDNYVRAIGRLGTVLFSTRIALITVVLSVGVGYPVAYFVYRFVSEKNRLPILLLLVFPFILNRLVKIFALTTLLSTRGPVNQILFFMEPLNLVHRELAVYIGMVNDTVPIAIVLIYISLERIDKDLLSASYDLGASGIHTFRKITLPLSAPGIVAAAILIFVITLGDEAIPEIMGGVGTYTIGIMMLSIFDAGQIPLAGAVSVFTLIIIGALLYLGQRFANIMALFEEIES